MNFNCLIMVRCFLSFSCLLYFIFSISQVDPFLSLVKDCKLQTVNAGSDHAKTMYGSKEDDNSALKCLSEMKLTEDPTQESLVSVIVKNLDNLSDVRI